MKHCFLYFANTVAKLYNREVEQLETFSETSQTMKRVVAKVSDLIDKDEILNEWSEERKGAFEKYKNRFFHLFSLLF
jgi:hypothetical protein